MLPNKKELISFGRQGWTHRFAVSSISKPEKLTGKVLYLLKEKKPKSTPASPEKKNPEAEVKEEKAPEEDTEKKGEAPPEAPSDDNTDDNTEEKKDETKEKKEEIPNPDYKGKCAQFFIPNRPRNTLHDSCPALYFRPTAKIR